MPRPPAPKKPAPWTVYIVRCANDSLYTGITNNLAGRIADHNAGRGAKYTAAFGPVELVWKKRKKDRSAASILEAAIKKLSRAEKNELISSIKTPLGGCLGGRISKTFRRPRLA